MTRPGAGEPGFDLVEAWHAHGRAILGYAVNSVGDLGLAEDCVQETYLRAWRARDRYTEHRGSSRTWLFSIARNVITDALRDRARRPTLLGADRVAGLLPAHTGQHDRVDDRLTLVAALAHLSPEHREVLVAVRIEGLSYAQLADRNGVLVATLRTRAYHALRALRAALEEEEHRA